MLEKKYFQEITDDYAFFQPWKFDTPPVGPPALLLPGRFWLNGVLVGAAALIVDAFVVVVVAVLVAATLIVGAFVVVVAGALFVGAIAAVDDDWWDNDVKTMSTIME